MTRNQRLARSYARSYYRAAQNARDYSAAGLRGTARDWAFTARLYLARCRAALESDEK